MPSRRFALVLAGVYLVFGFAWILFSDAALERVVDDVALLSRLQTVKGWFYVLLTAALLFVGAWVAMARIEGLLRRHVLTGLWNRDNFTERVQSLLDRERGTGRTVVVSVLSIDHFGDIDAGLGYAAGNAVLIEVADRLRGVFTDERCAHFAGAMFAYVSVVDGHAFEAQSRDDGRLREQLWRPIHVDGGDVEATGTLGSATSMDEDADAARLIRYAEIAHLEARRLGGDLRLFYRPEWQGAVSERRDLALRLRRAIADGVIGVAYQPQVDLASGDVYGVEVLARWTDPTLGVVPPGRFIDAAERSSQIAALTDLVMRKAMDELRGAGLFGTRVLRVAFNVSSHQFRTAERLGTFATLLDELGDEVRHLTFEITESDALHGTERVSTLLDGILQRGGTISIDDFGTGYSSLVQLKRLPIKELKIDRQFVMALPDSPGDLAIVRTVVAMGTALEMKVVAEGVETEVQRDLLRTMGCSIAQGYVIARPMPIDDLRAWLARHPAPPEARPCPPPARPC